jgi:carbon-monoxide dehydrogenase small subunit
VPAVIVDLTVNGERVTARVMHPVSLLDLLRDDLGLPGSKNACEQGECGSCSVLLDGELVCSCLVMAADADGSDVVTVEGIAPAGTLHPVQEAMHRAGRSRP